MDQLSLTQANFAIFRGDCVTIEAKVCFDCGHVDGLQILSLLVLWIRQLSEIVLERREVFIGKLHVGLSL